MTVSLASPFDRAVPTLPFALLTPFVSHRAVACADTDTVETDSAVIEVNIIFKINIILFLYERANQ